MQLTCDSFGFWAYDGSSSAAACSGTPTIELFGYGSLTVGEPLYTAAPCISSDTLSVDGFYSNGAVWFQYDGGLQEVIDIGSCSTPTPSPTPTPTNTETPTPTPTVTPTNTETPTPTPTNTETPTNTPTVTPTPTYTPTPSPTPGGEYCIINTTTYDGTYVVGGTYDGYNYFVGSTGYIFYSTSEVRWCLASNLGDPCVEFGPYGSVTNSPDLDDTVMIVGACVTTTTTTNPCATFDFDAIFDCYIPPTPSITPTNTVTPSFTPTPSATDPCGGRSMVVSISGVTPTTTPTPTPTPSSTPQITRPCPVSGTVVFNSISEIIQCANSKKFKDCFTGLDYYTSDLVLVSGSTSPKEGYVYNATINGLNYCVVFEGLFENISGVDNIVLTNEVGPSNLGSCLQCTPSTPNPILECIVVNSECGTVNVSPSGYLNGKLYYIFNLPFQIHPLRIYWDIINVRWVVEDYTTSTPGSFLYLDTTLPVGSLGEWVDSQIYVNCIESSALFFTGLLTVPCPSLTPTPTPTPSPTPCSQFQYRITNNSPAKVSAQYTVCGQKGNESVSLGGNTSVVVCSSSIPTTNNPQNVTIVPLGFSC